ncbi:MAG TPA: hypothetical protein VFQ34_08780 [Nitrospiraceae bacterium]|nr:hypothetical protein [Nitrospiraceae bacterium]
MKRRITGILGACIGLLWLGVPATGAESVADCDTRPLVIASQGAQKDGGPELDLGHWRELDRRRGRGEITENERQALWQAYLARLVPASCLKEKRPTALFSTFSKPLEFVGPGF